MASKKCEPGCTCRKHALTGPSPETAKKISQAKKGVPHGPMPQEIKDKIAEGNRGKVRSEEHRRRYSEAQRLARGTGRDRYISPAGYVQLIAQEQHPLMTGPARSAVLEHRKVLYDEIGPGPHPCHWGCGRLLEWGGHAGIQADHVDGDKTNNTPENLVPSCPSCNYRRARAGNPTEWAP